MSARILIVDDEPAIVDMLAYNLRRANYQVIIARDGEEALAKAVQEQPDLIILDLMLPRLDGLEVCRALRRERDVPIIMLTARDAEVDRVVGLELGADSSSSGVSGDSFDGDSDTAVDDDCASGVAAPLGGEEIDFNLLYAEKTAPPPLIENWGNIVLLVMLAGLGATFFLTAWTWEGWGSVVAGWLNDNVKVVSEAIVEADARVAEAGHDSVPSSAELAALFKRKPELRELWPRLVGSDSARLKKINQILSGKEMQ